MAEYCPKKREHDLKVEEFQGEALVYDLTSHRAHCLNDLAANVWRLCDGLASVADIAEQVGRARGVEPDEDLVWRALSELDGASLLETPLADAEQAGFSRRHAVAKLGWAVGIPLVLSIAVPEPAFAQSGGTGGPLQH